MGGDPRCDQCRDHLREAPPRGIWGRDGGGQAKEEPTMKTPKPKATPPSLAAEPEAPREEEAQAPTQVRHDRRGQHRHTPRRRKRQ
jgi:hypothetical protein